MGKLPYTRPGTGSFLVQPSSGPPGSGLVITRRFHHSPCPQEFIFFDHQEIGESVISNSRDLTLRNLFVPGDATPGRHIVTLACTASDTQPLHQQAFVVTSDGSHPMAFDTSINYPSQILVDVRSLSTSAVLTIGLLALALIIALGFPAEWFNDTIYNENKDRIEGAVRRILHLAQGPEPDRTRLKRNVALIGFLLAGGLLTALLSPGFGINWSSLWFLSGAVAGLAGVLVGFSLPTIIYGRTHGYDGKYYVLVGSVLVAIICVVLSRSLHFQPGYLYGLIAGFRC